MVNLIFKGKASATDFYVCQFLDESNFHVSWRSLSKRLCTRFWPTAVNFWTAPFATHSQVNLVIGTDNYKQHVIAAVLLSLPYSGGTRETSQSRDGAQVGVLFQKRPRQSSLAAGAVSAEMTSRAAARSEQNGQCISRELISDYIHFSIAVILNKTGFVTVKCNCK